LEVLVEKHLERPQPLFAHEKQGVDKRVPLADGRKYADRCHDRSRQRKDDAHEDGEMPGSVNESRLLDRRGIVCS